MILVLRDGQIVAQRYSEEDLMKLYPESEGYEIIDWDGSLSDIMDADGRLLSDPRTPEERDSDRINWPLRKRLMAVRKHLPVLLYLLYLDRKDGTNRFVEKIDQIRAEL